MSTEKSSLDFWPDEITTSTERAPVAILNEQAALLAAKTRNVITAEVRPVQTSYGQVRYDFTLVAPALDQYRFRLFGIQHKIDALYPVTIDCPADPFDSSAGPGVGKATNEEDFVARLKEVFRSQRVVRTIQSIRSQSEGLTGPLQTAA